MKDCSRLASVAAAATAMSCSFGPNTACKCGDDVQLHAQLKATADALSGANVWICKNGDCFAGKFGSITSNPILELGCDPTPGTCNYDIPTAQAASDGSGTYGVDFQFPNGKYDDGDVYQVAIASASGSTLISKV